MAILQDSMLSVQTHMLHVVFEIFRNVSGLVAVFFFCNQDPWSWVMAILQDSMPSVLTHLLLTFSFSFVLGSWLLDTCFTLMPETMASLRPASVCKVLAALLLEQYPSRSYFCPEGTRTAARSSGMSLAGVRGLAAWLWASLVT